RGRPGGRRAAARGHRRRARARYAPGALPPGGTPVEPLTCERRDLEVGGWRRTSIIEKANGFLREISPDSRPRGREGVARLAEGRHDGRVKRGLVVTARGLGEQVAEQAVAEVGVGVRAPARTGAQRPAGGAQEPRRRV